MGLGNPRTKGTDESTDGWADPTFSPAKLSGESGVGRASSSSFDFCYIEGDGVFSVNEAGLLTFSTIFVYSGLWFAVSAWLVCIFFTEVSALAKISDCPAFSCTVLSVYVNWFCCGDLKILEISSCPFYEFESVFAVSCCMAGVAWAVWSLCWDCTLARALSACPSS